MRINIEIGDIEAFIELTETNSFAKAATNLNLSQPALSRRIQKLEQELEVHSLKYHSGCRTCRNISTLP